MEEKIHLFFSLQNSRSSRSAWREGRVRVRRLSLNEGGAGILGFPMRIWPIFGSGFLVSALKNCSFSV